MAYTKNSFSAFEQPGLSKWNQLWNNDISFKDGTASPLPEGYMLNGKFTVTVTSSNLIIAIKTTAGNDPSVDDPVAVRIDNTVQLITAALSLTLNAGTNWFGSGATGLATQEIDYFVQLFWKASSSTVVLAFARVPAVDSYKTYSAYSGTSTNEKYLATSSTPASTDVGVVIGRFNAILSATASFNWSLPATQYIIQHPINYTRWLIYGSVPTGFSGTPIVTFTYQIRGDALTFNLKISGTSNTTGFTVPLPMAKSSSMALVHILTYGTDNGGDNAAFVEVNGSILNIYRVNGAAAGVAITTTGTWTNSGTKGVNVMETYQI